MNSKFLIYCNTRQFFSNKWRGEVFHNEFYLSDAELLRWNVTRAQLEAMPEIIKVDNNTYNVEGVSKIDISLLKPHGRPLTDLHKFMMKCVCDADLTTGEESTAYWQTFIKHRERFPELFFKVDRFSGRVHTPVSGMSKELRPLLLLGGEPVVSFDVAQMQPTLLANILRDNIGTNEFSEAIYSGVDVYVMLQQKAGLQTRDQAKKLFFRITFGRPSDDFARYFKDAKFIEWVNWYKTVDEPRKETRKEINHNNLAWLLQTYEVAMMSEIWQKLKANRIPFLTVHDEIICRKSDEGTAKSIIESVLSKHFKKYKLNIERTNADAIIEVLKAEPEAEAVEAVIPAPPAPRRKKTFYDIALEILGKQCNKTRSVLIDEMIKRYSISEAVATSGLEKLISNNVIELTTVEKDIERYYMTDSTPF